MAKGQYIELSNEEIRLHDKSSGLYLYSDLYIVDEFILEMQKKS